MSVTWQPNPKVYYGEDAEQRRIYLEGAYREVRLLTTSPRFNRPQMEVLHDRAAKLREELETLGVRFKDDE